VSDSICASSRAGEIVRGTINVARDHWNFDVWAFVFMPEHVHLITHPRDAVYDMADHRKAIKAPVAARAIAYLTVHAPEWIPKTTRQRGDHEERLFWQSGGGYDRNVVEPKTLLAMIDYIHLNPVRRGLVEWAVDWKWSRAGWFLEGRESPVPLDPIPPEWGASAELSNGSDAGATQLDASCALRWGLPSVDPSHPSRTFVTAYQVAESLGLESPVADERRLRNSSSRRLNSASVPRSTGW
jgi:putative transposase